MQTQKNRHIFTIVLLVCVLVVAGYYFLGSGGGPTSALANAPRIAYSGTPVDTTGWKTYTNAQYGFSFQYPSTLVAVPLATSDKYGAVLQVELQASAPNGHGGIAVTNPIAVMVRPVSQAAHMQSEGNVVSKTSATVEGRSVAVDNTVVLISAGGATSAQSLEDAVFTLGSHVYAVSVDQSSADDLYSILASFKTSSG